MARSEREFTWNDLARPGHESDAGIIKLCASITDERPEYLSDASRKAWLDKFKARSRILPAIAVSLLLHAMPAAFSERDKIAEWVKDQIDRPAPEMIAQDEAESDSKIIDKEKAEQQLEFLQRVVEMKKNGERIADLADFIMEAEYYGNAFTSEMRERSHQQVGADYGILNEFNNFSNSELSLAGRINSRSGAYSEDQNSFTYMMQPDDPSARRANCDSFSDYNAAMWSRLHSEDYDGGDIFFEIYNGIQGKQDGHRRLVVDRGDKYLVFDNNSSHYEEKPAEGHAPTTVEVSSYYIDAYLVANHVMEYENGSLSAGTGKPVQFSEPFASPASDVAYPSQLLTSDGQLTWRTDDQATMPHVTIAADGGDGEPGQTAGAEKEERIKIPEYRYGNSDLSLTFTPPEIADRLIAENTKVYGYDDAMVDIRDKKVSDNGVLQINLEGYENGISASGWRGVFSAKYSEADAQAGMHADIKTVEINSLNYRINERDIAEAAGFILTRPGAILNAGPIEIKANGESLMTIDPEHATLTLNDIIEYLKTGQDPWTFFERGKFYLTLDNSVLQAYIDNNLDQPWEEDWENIPMHTGDDLPDGAARVLYTFWSSYYRPRCRNIEYLEDPQTAALYADINELVFIRSIANKEVARALAAGGKINYLRLPSLPEPEILRALLVDSNIKIFSIWKGPISPEQYTVLADSDLEELSFDTFLDIGDIASLEKLQVQSLFFGEGLDKSDPYSQLVFVGTIKKMVEGGNLKELKLHLDKDLSPTAARALASIKFERLNIEIGSEKADSIAILVEQGKMQSLDLRTHEVNREIIDAFAQNPNIQALEFYNVDERDFPTEQFLRHIKARFPRSQVEADERSPGRFRLSGKQVIRKSPPPAKP